MLNPVEQISLALSRLKRVAALRGSLSLALPAFTAVALGAALEPIGGATWRRMGYVMATRTFDDVRMTLFAIGVAAIAGCVWMGWAAYRKADDFVEAAARVDDVVSARQEIVTLASLAGPREDQGGRAQRSALFPLLWRRAAGYLERFDPDRAFAMEIRRPLLRSSPIAAIIVALFAVASFALVRQPSPAELEAHKLRALANQIARSPSPADQALAAKIRSAAAALENPKLPPEEKLARLDELMRQLEKPPEQKSSASRNPQHGNGKASSNGNGSGQGKGQANGKGQGRGQGQGQGSGAGENRNGPKSKRQIAELKNDISKAQEQIETSSESQSKKPKPSQASTGSALKPGRNPDKNGSSNKPGKLAKAEIPKPGTSANQMPSSGKNGKGHKGGHGDTHLGEIPAPEKFTRFKLGKGPPIEIRDARYVLFRLPTDVIASGSGGKLVRDNSRQAVTAPYVNVPLKPERLDLAPQERQFVPPRYRDLIH